MVTIGAYDGVHLGHQAVIADVRQLAAGAKATLGRADVRPPPGHRRAARVGAAAADRRRAAPRAARRHRCRRHRRADVRRGAGQGAARGVHRAGARRGARREDRRRRRGLPLRQPPRRQRPPARGATATTNDFVVDPVASSAAATTSRSRSRSTAIRRALAGGEVELAARMLGRQHEVRGIVVVGDQRGRLLGFPTANVEVPERDVPAGRRRLRRLVRPPRRQRPPVRHQPRAPPDVLRARRPLAARGPPHRLRGRPVRRAGDVSASPTSCAASASSTASTPSRPS